MDSSRVESRAPVASVERPLLPTVDWALGRVATVCSVLGCEVEEHGYRGNVTLITAVLPLRTDYRIRHAVSKALREVFPVRDVGKDRLVQLALDRLDPGEKVPGYVDAADILRERGHTDIEIARLAGEFARDLLLVAKQDKLVRTDTDAQFGTHGQVEKKVALYHRVDDARLIEHVLASFRQRALFKRVMAGLPDPKAKQHPGPDRELQEAPVAKRRRILLDQCGRGRVRVQPGPGLVDS